MKGPDFRFRIKDKLKVDLIEAWLLLFVELPIISFLAGFLYTQYLINFSLLVLIFGFFFFFNCVFFRLLYTKRKRRFLKVYEIILHPLVNLLLLSVLFSFKLGYGVVFWIAFSFSFVLAVSIIWLHHFNDKGKKFQTVWIPHLAKKISKLHFFTLLLIVGVWISIDYLVPYFLDAGLVTSNLALFSTYLKWISYHLIVLAVSLIILVLVVNIKPIMTRKYCKICVDLIKERFSKKVRKDVFPSNDEYIRVFPDLINRVNGLLEFYYYEGIPPFIFNASYPPRILIKDLYCKKLFMADVIQRKQFLDFQDKQYLWDVKVGLDKISKSLDRKRDKFFYPFLEGVVQIANLGETEPSYTLEDGFELKPSSATRWVNEHSVGIGLIIMALTLVVAALGYFR